MRLATAVGLGLFLYGFGADGTSGNASQLILAFDVSSRSYVPIIVESGTLDPFLTLEVPYQTQEEM